MTAPHNFSNTASAATLAGSLSSSATEVALDSFANFPAPPFTATIARNQPTEEIVLVTAVAGFTVTLTRGYDGTSAQAQSPGATFEHTAVAKHFRDAAAHVATTGVVHGLTGSIVGTTDAQTLSNKTVLALLALATAGAPALTADAPTGVTSKLLSLKQAGVEKAFVDYLGNLTAVGVTGTNASLSGTLSVAGVAALGAGATVAGTPSAATHIVPKSYADALGVAAATASTIVRRDANGDTAIDAVTLTDAPSAAAHATRKDYVDSGNAAINAKVDVAGASRTLHQHHGNVAAFPTANIKSGDTCTRTDLANSVWQYAATGIVGWFPITPVAGKMWRTSGFSGAMALEADLVVGMDAARVSAGVTFDATADTLTIPVDGIYRLSGFGYVSGGSGYQATLHARRGRASVADTTAVLFGSQAKTTTQDAWISGSGLAPLKAGDKVFLIVRFANLGSGSNPNYHGVNEAAGCQLTAEFVQPLNGTTPL